jgi:hypothetical protein
VPSFPKKAASLVLFGDVSGRVCGCAKAAPLLCCPSRRQKDKRSIAGSYGRGVACVSHENRGKMCVSQRDVPFFTGMSHQHLTKRDARWSKVCALSRRQGCRAPERTLSLHSPPVFARLVMRFAARLKSLFVHQCSVAPSLVRHWRRCWQNSCGSTSKVICVIQDIRGAGAAR